MSKSKKKVFGLIDSRVTVEPLFRGLAHLRIVHRFMQERASEQTPSSMHYVRTFGGSVFLSVDRGPRF